MESMNLNGGQLSNGVMMLVVALELSVVWHLVIFFGSAQQRSAMFGTHISGTMTVIHSGCDGQDLSLLVLLLIHQK